MDLHKNLSKFHLKYSPYISIIKNWDNRYKPINCLGKGGYSLVFKTIKEEKFLVVKCLKSDYCNEEYEILKILKPLKHPHIVEIIDIVNKQVFVFEYCNGGTLYEYLKKNKIDQDELRSFASQILSGLNHLHSNNFVHRDIQFMNILIHENEHKKNVYKISDFGLAKHNFKVLNTNVGTDRFKAPEITQKKSYTNSVDIYSFGVTLYYMLNPSYRDLMNLPDRIADLPDKEFQDLKDLLFKMTESKPHKRITLKEIIDSKWMQDKDIPLTIKGIKNDSITLRDFKQIKDHLLSSCDPSSRIKYLYETFKIENSKLEISFYDSNYLYEIDQICEERPYYTVDRIYLSKYDSPIHFKNGSGENEITNRQKDAYMLSNGSNANELKKLELEKEKKDEEEKLEKMKETLEKEKEELEKDKERLEKERDRIKNEKKNIETEFKVNLEKELIEIEKVKLKKVRLEKLIANESSKLTLDGLIKHQNEKIEKDQKEITNLESQIKKIIIN